MGLKDIPIHYIDETFERDIFGGEDISSKKLVKRSINDIFDEVEEVFERGKFYDTSFTFPGANKSVTGKEIIDSVNSIFVSDTGPSMAFAVGDLEMVSSQGTKFTVPKGSITFNSNYLRTGINFKEGTIHEFGHVTSSLLGTNSGVAEASLNIGSKTLEELKILGAEEGRADNFFKTIMSKAGSPGQKGTYPTLHEVIKSQDLIYGMLDADEREEVYKELFNDKRLASGLKEKITPSSRIELGKYAGLTEENVQDLAKTLQGEEGHFAKSFTDDLVKKIDTMSAAYEETFSQDMLATGKGIDFNNPETWKVMDDGTVNVGRSTNMSAESASQQKRIIYQEKAQKSLQDNPQVSQKLADIESDLTSWQNKSSKGQRLTANPEYGKLADDTLSEIYKDVSEGVSPQEALNKHISKLNLPKEVEETVLKRAELLAENIPIGELPENFPSMPEVSQQELAARFKGVKVETPSAPSVSEAVGQASVKDVSSKNVSSSDDLLDIWDKERPPRTAASKPIDDSDDIWAALKSEEPPKAVAPKPLPKSEPVIKVGKPIESPAATSKRVTQTGNATPKARTSATGERVFVTGERSASTTASTAARVQAQIVDDTIKKTASTGAPVKETTKLRGMADNVSEAIAKGTKNAGNLKMLGLAAAVGVGAIAIGASGIKRTQQDNIDRRLEMQRKGILKQ